MKILVSDRISKKGLDILSRASGLEVSYEPAIQAKELLEKMKDTAALVVRSRTQVTREVIEAAPHLQVIGRAGAGVDNIDLPAATRKGVLVMNTPGGNSVSAAEHAFALLIAMSRKLPLANTSVKTGEWNKSAFVGQELRGKVLGILGLGKIGSLLARRARAFQMQILAYDPFVTQDYASDLGAQLTDLNSVFSQADYLSFHLPLNAETQGIVNTSSLSLMKPSVFIVNTARGGLIREADLVEALEANRIAGAALDVFEKEPQISEALRQSEKVILTPHIAGSTVEAHEQVGVAIATQVLDYLKSHLITNAVNFPSLTSRELEQISPFLQLAFRLGSFASQICNIRISEIGVRYYGELTKLDYRPITNHLLKAVLQPRLAEPVNEVNARTYASARGIHVKETVSTRARGHANLISVQLRNPDEKVWIEGSILHKGKMWLVSVDGIPLETPLGDFVLFIRNQDTPGVVGRVGTLLGQNSVNIASFVLGREDEMSRALGVINTDNPVPEEVMEQIREIPAISYAQLVRL